LAPKTATATPTQLLSKANVVVEIVSKKGKGKAKADEPLSLEELAEIEDDPDAGEEAEDMPVDVQIPDDDGEIDMSPLNNN
jgi:hypothetical protein